MQMSLNFHWQVGDRLIGGLAAARELFSLILLKQPVAVKSGLKIFSWKRENLGNTQEWSLAGW